MPDRELADLQARMKFVESEVEGLRSKYNTLNVTTVAAIAAAKIKWWVLIRVVSFITIAAVIVGGLVKLGVLK